MAYLSVHFGTGTMYEKSKTPKEGFSEYSWDTFGGGTAYRKEHRVIEGALVGAKLGKVTFKDKEFYQFSISLKNGEEYFNLQMDVLNKFGAIDSYLENFISKIPNLKKGETYSLSSYSYLPDGEKYAKKGYSIKSGDTKIEKGLSFAYYSKADDKGNRTLVEGDVPPVVVKEKKAFDGSVKREFDNEAKTAFLFNYLKEWVETNFPQDGGDSAKTESKPTSKPTTKTREQEVDSQFTQKGKDTDVSTFVDDLPF